MIGRVLTLGLVLLVAAAPRVFAQSSSSSGSSGPLGPYTGSTDMNAEGASAAGAVSNKFGTAQTMGNGLGQPLASPTQMTTVNGATGFNAQTGCPATSAYLQLTMFPNSTGDIQQVAIDQDQNFSGSYTAHYLMTGPFAGVCNNGLISCDPGTFSNCRYLQWQATSTSISLNPVTQESLGACYCVNNYCGANLALSNSQKVLTDMAGGITLALNTVYPRLAMAQSTFPDPTQVVYYGNQTGCNTGGSTQPDNYYNNGNTASLPAAGTAAAANPSSGYYMVLNSPAGQGDGVSSMSCSVNRQFDLTNVSKNNVIQILSRTQGATADCGAGCLQLTLGLQASANYWTEGGAGQGCGLFSDHEQIQVTGGQFVQSVTLQQFNVDDYGQEVINGGVTWTDPQASGWTNPAQSWIPGGNCESNQVNYFSPNVDETSYFKNDGVVNVQNNDSVGGTGQAWSVTRFMVNEGCQIHDTYVNDGCAAAEANSACQLKDETVDGVPTVQNYVSTGLVPVPQTQDVDTSACNYGNVTEPWFVKQRTYVCKTGTPPNYDFSDAVQRYQSIHSSFDPTTGNYTDRTVTSAGGSPVFTERNDPLPTAQTVPACTQSCEVSAPQIGANVGDQAGATNTLNGTGLPLVYSFRACTSGGTVCPVNAGETLVTACSCRNTFAKAAASMQVIRMMGQDTICTTGN